MRKLIAFALAAVLLMALALSVSAAEIPDPNRKCSLKLVLEWEGDPLDSGRLTLYRVGEIGEDDGDYFFTPVTELRNSGVSLENLKDTNLPKKLADLAVRKKLEPIQVKIRDGEAAASSLQTGLYVVTQTESGASKGFEPIRPFLISLPQWDGDSYDYDREAKPKVSLQEEESTKPKETEPTKPKDPVLPQTGQWNWPVPVMAVSGLVLILAGWILCFGKKAGHEE